MNTNITPEEAVKNLHYINQAVLIKGIGKTYDRLRDTIIFAESLCKKIVDGEYVKVIHAHWLYSGSIDCCCSNCGRQPDHEDGSSVPEYDICPYCGAVMDEKID